MSDDLGLFDSDGDARPAPRRVEPDPRSRSGGRRKRRRSAVTWLVVVAMLVGVGAAAWFGLREIAGLGGYDDYTGSGEVNVLVEVSSGETTSDIGENLVNANVVASVKAFTKAAADNAKVLGVQPGYYVMKTKMSGSAAVAKIVQPASKVGALEVRPGNRLDDTKLPNGSVTPGIYSKLSKASCAELGGKSTCVSAARLRQVAQTAELSSLGVPDWALASAKRADPRHRLEGLIAPDVYQVKPGDSAQQLLTSLITSSALRWQADGMPTIAKGSGFTSYQLLVIASLSQSEAVRADFGKVARVTYNRLAANHKLQYDSTVNYVLERPEIRTKPSDRAKSGPYNTYANPGLPPTPISSPSKQALRAAANPTPGSWMYFVKCEKNGLSCFADTAAEHQRNVNEAQARGAY
ncbi:MAG: endolytic transglycosylase MltG [Sciscionella sp.]